MKRSVTMALLAVGFLVTVCAVAQDAPKPAEPMKMPMMQGDMCPACPMMDKKEMTPEMTKIREEMMKEAGITEDAMKMCKAMMMAPMYPTSPGTLTGMEDLKLTDNQKAKLAEIEKKAAADALTVLTDEQKAMLPKTPGEAMTPMGQMMEMHKKMMPVMEKRIKEGKPMPMCCPMMQKMMNEKEGKEGTTTGPAPDNSGINVRDRAPDAKTAGAAGQTKSDVQLAADIRKGIMDTKMSMNAQNSKIVVQSGKVTLRGPVKTQEEKDAIGRIAIDVAGAANVDNQLEVESKP
jgi:hypothetical protein